MSDTVVKETVPIHQITRRPEVLLVCNDEQAADYYKSHFTDLGCEPTNAWTPEHALELFQSYYVNGSGFLLVCMDLMLEGMNGITLGRHIKAIDPGCLLYLLPCTHFYESPILEDFHDFGGFIMEPNPSEEAFIELQKLVFEKKWGL